MIKTAQIEQLKEAGLYYITGITKPQIESLIGKGLLQLNMFEEELCEVKDSENNVRYILRRNPFRAEDITQNRSSKLTAIAQKAESANKYLSSHQRAKVSVQKKHLEDYIQKLKLEKIVSVNTDAQSRKLCIQIDENNLKEMSRLDGCYAIKTDLPSNVANKNTVHKRYKSLSEVEWAFRTVKSILDVRPIHLRKAERTIAYLVICMFAYQIEKFLHSRWADLNYTVQEGINILSTLTTTKIIVGNTELITLPQPSRDCQELLNRINVKIPSVLPDRVTNVATYKKLQLNRK